MTTSTNATLDPNAALVVVDVQQGFDDAAFWGPRNNPDSEANVARLIDAWRRTDRPIVVVRHDSIHPKSPLHPSSPGNALQDFVASVQPDLFITKTVNSAFYGTPDLNAWLAARGVRQIVLSGIQTNMCVETTARMGGNLGYDVLFALDATHTFDVAGPDGVVLSAHELSRATAATLHGGGFATVLSTDEVLARVPVREPADALQ